MKFKRFKFLFSFVFAIILTLGLSISLQSLLAAWTAPLSNPPACLTGNPGCDAPLSSGSVLMQQMQGALWIVNSAGSPYGLIVENGKVGIGTAAPNYKLDVQGGQINSSGGLLIKGSAVIDAIGKWVGDPTGLVGPQGPIGLTGLTGATGATGSQGPTGLLQAGSSAGNTPYWNGSSWITNSSNIFNNGGNVGIGTAAPSQKLDVAGYVKGQSGLCIGNDCRISWPVGGTGDITGNGNNGYLAKFTGSKTIANSVIYDNGYGFVGIGATNPMAKLDVRGDIIWTGAYAYWIGMLTTNVSQMSAIVQARTGFRLDLIASDPAYYPNNGIFILTNGNVGIGTRNPAYKLDVNGTFAATTKLFDILYPEKPGYRLVHSTLEGPEVGVYYRGTAQLKNGQAAITLPPYFANLTREGSETVFLTARGATPFILSYSNFNHAAGTFIVYGSIPDGTFDWQVEATRADVPTLQVVKPDSAGQ